MYRILPLFLAILEVKVAATNVSRTAATHHLVGSAGTFVNGTANRPALSISSAPSLERASKRTQRNPRVATSVRPAETTFETYLLD